MFEFCLLTILIDMKTVLLQFSTGMIGFSSDKRVLLRSPPSNKTSENVAVLLFTLGVM